jgi:DNA-binding transcriptional MerR regulator/quercetin dioxygenase-like cupin family protein
LPLTRKTGFTKIWRQRDCHLDMTKNIYYRIGEAARILGISQSSLRNWERRGLLSPVRSQGHFRLYSRAELQKLRQIKFLRKIKRVNPAGIAAMLENRQGESPVRNSNDKSNGPTVGQRLLRLRNRARLTLVSVARRACISASFLSSLEHDLANPSIATLQKLARLYDTNVLSFFNEKRTTRRLVHPRDRKAFKPNPGVLMELLAFGKTCMEPHLFRIAPGASSGGSYDHAGEEFIYVMDGKLEIWLDEIERYEMETGDSLYFESTLAHRWRNLSDGETVLLWVNTPPTF